MKLISKFPKFKILYKALWCWLGREKPLLFKKWGEASLDVLK